MDVIYLPRPIKHFEMIPGYELLTLTILSQVYSRPDNKVNLKKFCIQGDDYNKIVNSSEKSFNTIHAISGYLKELELKRLSEVSDLNLNAFKEIINIKSIFTYTNPTFIELGENEELSGKKMLDFWISSNTIIYGDHLNDSTIKDVFNLRQTKKILIWKIFRLNFHYIIRIYLNEKTYYIKNTQTLNYIDTSSADLIAACYSSDVNIDFINTKSGLKHSKPTFDLPNSPIKSVNFDAFDFFIQAMENVVSNAQPAGNQCQNLLDDIQKMALNSGIYSKFVFRRKSSYLYSPITLFPQMDFDSLQKYYSNLNIQDISIDNIRKLYLFIRNCYNSFLIWIKYTNLFFEKYKNQKKIDCSLLHAMILSNRFQVPQVNRIMFSILQWAILEVTKDKKKQNIINDGYTFFGETFTTCLRSATNNSNPDIQPPSNYKFPNIKIDDDIFDINHEVCKFKQNISENKKIQSKIKNIMHYNKIEISKKIMDHIETFKCRFLPTQPEQT